EWRGSVIDSTSVRSVQACVTIISSARFITGITSEGLDLFRVQMKSRSRRGHHVLLHHHGTEVVGAIFYRHLPNAGPLRDQRTLDVGDVAQNNPLQRL